MKTFTLSNNVEVKSGDDLTSFRGDQWVFVKAIRPNDTGHDGKVEVRELGSESTRVFYAGVFNLKVTA